MSKSKRLMELMMTINRMRKFKVQELADEFGVSSRTILRDLQELSELGVPLYSEVGPHGGYQVLKERILPPIAFSEEEAVAIFFASHALRHYLFTPFETESASGLNKFYFYMSGEVRDRIDQMKNRVDIITPTRQLVSPHLLILLEAAIQQKVLLIDYKAREENSARTIQPIGIYASNGIWYCPAYCFTREDYRLFRCDRIHSAAYELEPITAQPLDLHHVHLGNWESFIKIKQEVVDLEVELSKEGVQRCETELGRRFALNLREDGTGYLNHSIAKSDIPFVAKLLIGYGNDATVKNPPELVDLIKQTLTEIMAKYV